MGCGWTQVSMNLGKFNGHTTYLPIRYPYKLSTIFYLDSSCFLYRYWSVDFPVQVHILLCSLSGTSLKEILHICRDKVFDHYFRQLTLGLDLIHHVFDSFVVGLFRLKACWLVNLEAKVVCPEWSTFEVPVLVLLEHLS